MEIVGVGMIIMTGGMVMTKMVDDPVVEVEAVVVHEVAVAEDEVEGEEIAILEKVVVLEKEILEEKMRVAKKVILILLYSFIIFYIKCIYICNVVCCHLLWREIYFIGEEGEKKPKEIYIPPEPTNDENELFYGITTGINFAKYDDIEVNVTGENCPRAITSFESAGLRPLVLENIQKSGYKKPTPIQKHSIPIIMSRRDLMACAQTGSGKTVKFLSRCIRSNYFSISVYNFRLRFCYL